uniref:Pep44a n=1 Tax=Punavirus P1 TaxID=10678 RepID=O48378_9CAUD|nr:pep44a [Escherichia phage P1]
MSKTTPTKDSIRAEFEELVEKDSFWSKFVGSQFVSMLTLFITQIVYRCFQYADAALAEGFISTRRGVPLSWQRQKRIVTLVPSQHRHRG